MPTRHGGGHNRGRTRYQPIVDHLAACAEGELVLSIDEIEAILGASLPDTAYGTTTFWTGETRLYVRRWCSLGWRARYDRRNLCVIFTRDAEEG